MSFSCGCGVLGAEFADEVFVALVDGAVDEVVDDLDRPGDFEIADGGALEVFGDGGDAVALVDAEAGDGEVAGVLADERDIRPVEGGDEGQANALGFEHLAGEKGRDRVGNGVVHVEKIELVELRDLGHAAGEGEVVRRVLEERVVGDGDFVEEDAVLTAGEAEGLLVGDEVDLVAAGGKLNAELCGDDAGAAVGGVAGDADFHRGGPGWQRFIGWPRFAFCRRGSRAAV